MSARLAKRLVAIVRTHPLLWAMTWAALVATATCLWVTRFVGLDYPLDYEGDTLLVWLIVKTLATHPWVFGNEALGLPAFMELNHFPMSFVGQLLVLKGMTMLGLGPIAVINVYFVATFGATAAAATWALSRLHLCHVWAALGAVVFALLPYHFLRMPHHLFLAAYYMVPLGAVVAIELDTASLPSAAKLKQYAALCCLTTLFGDIYYTFFLGYLLGAQGLFRALGHRCWAHLFVRLKLLGGMLVTLGAAMSPALWALYRPGAEASPLVRPANDSETYGLKLIQMLLPAPGHRTAWLRSMTDTYRATAPLVTENQTASLGLVGAGCLVAVSIVGLVSLYRPEDGASARAHCGPPCIVQRVSVAILLAFLFGTVGGLSAVFGYGVTTFIRCGNRISVLIAFLAVTGGMHLLQRLTQRGDVHGIWRVGLALFILGIALWDTGDVLYFPARHAAAKRFDEDRAFFAQLQKRVAPGTLLFELPFVTFVEGGLGARDYLQALPYLHTDGLKFSFGAFRGTSGDRRNRHTAALFSGSDVQKAKSHMQREGFDGLLVNEVLDARQSPSVLHRLGEAFGPPRLVSPSGRFVYFDAPPTSFEPETSSHVD